MDVKYYKFLHELQWNLRKRCSVLTTKRVTEWEMSEQGKLVCVTGASGYIASWLVKLLLQRGYTVKATVRDPSLPNYKTSYLQHCSFSNPTCYYPQFSSFFIVSVVFSIMLVLCMWVGRYLAVWSLDWVVFWWVFVLFPFSRSLIYDWKSMFTTQLFVLS